MPIEMRQLRHVLALAEHGSFARAAVASQLSQPALSRSIQGVERKSGSRLFRRLPTGTAPTDIGRLFIDRAREIVRMADALDEEVLRDRMLQPGHFIVGGGPYPGQSMLSTAIARFISVYPRVRTKLQIGDWDDLLQSLRHRQLDLFVAEISTLEREPDLEIEPMARHPLFYAARNGHPLAGRGNVGAAGAFSYPMIAMSRISPRGLGPLLTARRRSPDPSALMRAFPAVECHSQSAVTRIVRNSNAIMVTTLSCIASELGHRELVVLGSEPWLHLRYGIVRLKARPLSAPVAKFREFVLAEEIALSIEEDRLIARWKPTATVASTRRPAAVSRGKRRRAGTR